MFNEIIKNYETKHKQLLFDYLQSLITCLNDWQFYNVFTENEELFDELNSKDSDSYTKSELYTAIYLVINEIKDTEV